MSNAYDFPETSACRGTVSIIVNVASRCGYTHGHYKQLVAMCKKLGPAGFNVIAFPGTQRAFLQPMFT
jgi:glutathione peroxidase-family protein